MDRFTIGIAAGVLALVAAGLVVATTVRGRSEPPDLTTPSGVVLAYALAEQHGDAQAAWDLLAASAQSRADRDRFLAQAGRTDSAASNEYLTTEDERIDGDTASVVLARTYAGSGSLFGDSRSTVRSTVRLTREPAGWRITIPPDAYNLVGPARP
jgi:hypothetical protein